MKNNLEKIKLENGLTIYLYQDMRRHSTFFQIVTLFGGLTKDFVFNNNTYHMQDGIAHILEHYVVEHNIKGNFIKLLGEKQMNTNASTHLNMTRYYFEAVEDVEYGIESMLTGIYNVNFNNENLMKIKGPIFQEIKGRMNNKFYYLNKENFNNLFTNIDFKSIGGSIEDVEKTTLDDIELCYNAFYHPNNQFIVIAGNFDKKKILSYIENFYNKLNFPENDLKVLKVKENKGITKNESTIYFPTGMDYVEVSYKIDLSDFSNRERLDLDFYNSFFYNMFFGITSDTYKKLVQEKIISGSISYSCQFIHNYMLISLGAYTEYKNDFINEITNTINNLNSFNEELFEIDKKRIILDIILRDESLLHTILPFVDNIVSFDYPYLDTVDDIKNFSFDGFVNFIKKLDFSNYTIITIKDKNKKN